MEINTEINKVFGMEMAKIFASSISEEEINNTAKKVWGQLSSHVSEYGRMKNSDIENYIRNVLLEKLHEKILMILQEPKNDEAIEEEARELVRKAKEVAEKAIVRSIADGITSRTLSAWNTHDKFVDDVLRVLYVEKQNGRL